MQKHSGLLVFSYRFLGHVGECNIIMMVRIIVVVFIIVRVGLGGGETQSRAVAFVVSRRVEIAVVTKVVGAMNLEVIPFVAKPTEGPVTRVFRGSVRTGGRGDGMRRGCRGININWVFHGSSSIPESYSFLPKSLLRVGKGDTE